MTNDQLLEGVQQAARAVELMPGPLWKLIGAGLELTAEAVRIGGNDPAHDPAALLVMLRSKLGSMIADELQRTLDESVHG